MKQTVEPINKDKGYLTQLEQITAMELKCIESGLASDISLMNMMTRNYLGEFVFTYKDPFKKLYNKLEDETNKVCAMILEGYTTCTALKILSLHSSTFFIEANEEQKLRIKLAKKEAVKLYGNSGLKELNIN